MSKAAPTEAGTTRLHVVTGKGGTGKSTMAGALALALARAGRRVLLCEVEGRQGIAQLFGRDPMPYAEERIGSGPDGEGDLYGLSIDARSAMEEYLRLYYRLGGPAGRLMERFGVTDFATTLAPGLRDVLLTGKVYEAVDRNPRNRAAIVYDDVVLDGPPTGRIVQFLLVNGEFGDLAKVGAVRNQTEKVMALLRSDRTAVHVTTLLEDMPVRETAEGVAELRAAGLPVGQVLVNQIQPRELDPWLADSLDGTLPMDRVGAELVSVGVATTDDVLAGLARDAQGLAERRSLEAAEEARIEALGVPLARFPELPGGIDPAALGELAMQMRKQGLA
ncbi:MAG TPA: ArsA-related P-loop ATPase [Nocardioides sp.]|nr:ArsA-related P-loop ATPase [Nocardioides sp.]